MNKPGLEKDLLTNPTISVLPTLSWWVPPSYFLPPSWISLCKCCIKRVAVTGPRPNEEEELGFVCATSVWYYAGKVMAMRRLKFSSLLFEKSGDGWSPVRASEWGWNGWRSRDVACVYVCMYVCIRRYVFQYWYAVPWITLDSDTGSDSTPTDSFSPHRPLLTQLVSLYRMQCWTRNDWDIYENDALARVFCCWTSLVVFSWGKWGNGGIFRENAKTRATIRSTDGQDRKFYAVFVWNSMSWVPISIKWTRYKI